MLYASLYPFTGWRWPPGPSLGALLALPWPPWRDPFDVWSNLLGYVPLGALLYVAQVRGGRAAWRAALLALLAASALSYLTEVVQQFLPGRVPSRVDWALNSAGAAAGAALAALLQALGLLQRWQALRERWFVRDSAGGLSLLALWPVGLLFPTPVPLGLGHVAEQLRDAAAGAVRGRALGRAVSSTCCRARPTARSRCRRCRTGWCSCWACWRRAWWPSAWRGAACGVRCWSPGCWRSACWPPPCRPR